MRTTKFITTLIVCLFHYYSSSQCVYTAVSNGFWENPSTWVKSNCSNSSSNIPSNGSIIIIPSGRTITLNSNPSYEGVDIQVHGVLMFETSKKMILDCLSSIIVEQGGIIDGVGNNSSQKIAFCNLGWVWNGDYTAGPFNIGSNPLPVTLSDFYGVKQNNQSILVNWVTESEQNSAIFELYHSKDGLNWELIHIKMAAGNSTQKLVYQFLHKEVNKGSNYYQLKQIDRDGKYSFSEVINISMVVDPLVKIYPNPANDFVNIEVDPYNSKSSLVQIIDISGREKYNELIEQNIISKTIATNQLENGAYLIYVNGIMQGKLMINH